MKKIIIISLYSIYIFIVLGFVFHTSSHPLIFEKYTQKYFLVLTLLVFGFIPSLWFINFLFKTTKLKYKKKKIILKPWHKVLITVVLFIVLISAGEIFLRNKYKNFESNSYRYTVENFHPFLQTQISKHEELPVNSLGFRGEEITASKSADTFRIVILGGSTVLNREVSFENNAARVLEKKLRKEFPDKNIEVINAGKDSYTTEHSLIQYMFNISDLDPDLIIMWHGYNDMNQSCLNEGVLTHGEFKSDYSHSYALISNLVFEYFQLPPVIKVKLLTLDFGLRSLQDNLYSDFTNKVTAAKRQQAAINYKSNKNTIDVHGFESLPAYERNLNFTVKTLNDQNIPMIIGNQASLFKDDNSIEEVKRIMFPAVPCQKNGKLYSLHSYKKGLDDFNKKTEEIANANNILFVDFDKIIPKTSDYFFDSIHYTKKGNAKIAEALASLILLQNLISSNE